MNKRNRSSIRKKAEAKTSSGKQISQIEIVYAAQIERLGKRRTFLDQGDKIIQRQSGKQQKQKTQYKNESSGK